MAFFLAISVGVSVILGRNIGKNDIKHGFEVARQGIILSIIIGVVLGLLSLFFGPCFLLFTGCSEEIFTYALPYFMAVSVPSVFLSLSLTLSACLRGIKDTKTPMFLTTICNFLNILLNIVFLKLELGMFGIGLATTLSRLFLVVSLFAVLLIKNEEFYLQFRKIRVNLPVLQEISIISLPACGEKLAMRTGQLAYTTILLGLGTEAYVAHTLTATLENYIYIPIFSFATTTSILVSISLGEGNPVKANQYVSILRRINTLVLAGFSLVFVLFGKRLVGIFTNSQEVVSDTYPLLVILACAVPFMGILNLYTSALQGSGDSKTPMYSTLVGIWGIRLGLGFLFLQVFQWGILGFWMVILIDCAIRSLILYTVYLRKFKSKSKLPLSYVCKEKGTP